MASVEDLTAAVAALDYTSAVSLVKEALGRGEATTDIVDATQAGLMLVGERYERQEIFLSGLIMAGEIFRGVMETIRPDWEDLVPGESASGRVLVGTVAGDIHDLGKSMATLAFRAFGFAVDDLGVDVPPEAFLAAADRVQPDIIGLSGLLTGAFDSMRKTVTLIRQNYPATEGAPLIVIGGATIDEHVAQYTGADLWTTDAMEGVRACQHLLESRRQSR